jgi:ribosomal protein L11
MASAAPPLGPELGQRGINVANFCKDFNRQTEHIKKGLSLVGNLMILHVQVPYFRLVSP